VDADDVVELLRPSRSRSLRIHHVTPRSSCAPPYRGLCSASTCRERGRTRVEEEPSAAAPPAAVPRRRRLRSPLMEHLLASRCWSTPASICFFPRRIHWRKG
jgi:hypothetical protein